MYKFGEKILVSAYSDFARPKERIYLHDGLLGCVFCVDQTSEDSFKEKKDEYVAIPWKYHKPLPTKKYIPFTDEDAELFRDRWVKGIGGYDLFKIMRYDCKGIYIVHDIKMKFKYAECLESFIFEDGSPFGKLVN